jgi:hypothetical protein
VNTGVLLFFLEGIIHTQFYKCSDEKGTKYSRENQRYKWKIKGLGMSMRLQGTLRDTYYAIHNIIVYGNAMVPKVPNITTISVPL